MALFWWMSAIVFSVGTRLFYRGLLGVLLLFAIVSYCSAWFQHSFTNSFVRSFMVIISVFRYSEKGRTGCFAGWCVYLGFFGGTWVAFLIGGNTWKIWNHHSLSRVSLARLTGWPVCLFQKGRARRCCFWWWWWCLFALGGGIIYKKKSRELK